MSRRDGKCTRCEAPDAESCMSFGAYAGFLCETCAINDYRDHCGLAWSDEEDIDEELDPEPSCFPEYDL